MKNVITLAMLLAFAVGGATFSSATARGNARSAGPAARPGPVAVNNHKKAASVARSDGRTMGVPPIAKVPPSAVTGKGKKK